MWNRLILIAGYLAFERQGKASQAMGRGLGGQVLHDALVVDELLCDETSHREHSEAAVLQFLGLDLRELLGILGLRRQSDGPQSAREGAFSTSFVNRRAIYVLE